MTHLLYAGVVQEEEKQRTFYIDVDVPGIIVNMSKKLKMGSKLLGCQE